MWEAVAYSCWYVTLNNVLIESAITNFLVFLIGIFFWNILHWAVQATWLSDDFLINMGSIKIPGGPEVLAHPSFWSFSMETSAHVTPAVIFKRNHLWIISNIFIHPFNSISFQGALCPFKQLEYSLRRWKFPSTHPCLFIPFIRFYGRGCVRERRWGKLKGLSPLPCLFKIPRNEKRLARDLEVVGWGLLEPSGLFPCQPELRRHSQGPRSCRGTWVCSCLKASKESAARFCKRNHTWRVPEGREHM